MNEDKNNSIPSPYVSTPSHEVITKTIPNKMLDAIKALITLYGYQDIFIAVHKQSEDKSCEWLAASTVKSPCLDHYLKSIAESIKSD